MKPVSSSGGTETAELGRRSRNERRLLLSADVVRGGGRVERESCAVQFPELLPPSSARLVLGPSSDGCADLVRSRCAFMGPLPLDHRSPAPSEPSAWRLKGAGFDNGAEHQMGSDPGPTPGGGGFCGRLGLVLTPRDATDADPVRCSFRASSSVSPIARACPAAQNSSAGPALPTAGRDPCSTSPQCRRGSRAQTKWTVESRLVEEAGESFRGSEPRAVLSS
jgi:hypothetical protein